MYNTLVPDTKHKLELITVDVRFVPGALLLCAMLAVQVLLGYLGGVLQILWVLIALVAISRWSAFNRVPRWFPPPSVTIAMICIGRHLDRQYGPPSPISIEEFRESIEWIASGKATLIRHQPKHFLGFDLGDTIQVDVSVGVEATKSPLCLLRGMIEVDRKKLATEGQSWLIGKAATRRNGLEGGISTHLVLTEIPSDSPHKGGLEYHLFVEGKRGDRRNRIPCSRSDECLAAL